MISVYLLLDFDEVSLDLVTEYPNLRELFRLFSHSLRILMNYLYPSLRS